MSNSFDPSHISIPEFGQTTSTMGTIRVAGERTIPLTRRVREVVDHPAFQRLRNVRQLGPTHLVYPGATHSRFEHSLGVYGTTREFLLTLLRTPAFAASVSESQLMAALAAGLLHDIGHYPFAHSLEALHHKGGDTPRHEPLGAEILLGKHPFLNQGEKPIADILRWQWKTDPQMVVRLMTWKRADLDNPVERILQSIINGTIDADKMDYMERDSAHLGVPYGTHYDRSRLLSSLTLNEAEDHIALWAKAKLSAETFVFCRFTLFSEVYWHHTVRAASAMVESSLAEAVQGQSADELATALLTHPDDRLLMDWKERAARGSISARLLSGLTGNRRRLYKRIMTFAPVYLENEKKEAYEKLVTMQAEATVELRRRLEERVASLVGHVLAPGSILVDIPPRDKDKLDTFPVRFSNVRGQSEYPLHQLSNIVNGVQQDMLNVVKKARIFCDPVTTAELQGRFGAVEEAMLEEVLAS